MYDLPTGTSPLILTPSFTHRILIPHPFSYPFFHSSPHPFLSLTLLPRYNSWVLQLCLLHHGHSLHLPCRDCLCMCLLSTGKCWKKKIQKFFFQKFFDKISPATRQDLSHFSGGKFLNFVCFLILLYPRYGGRREEVRVRRVLLY